MSWNPEEDGGTLVSIALELIEGNHIARERDERAKALEARALARLDESIVDRGEDRAARNFENAVLEETGKWVEHPDGWPFACHCQLCCSYAEARISQKLHARIHELEKLLGVFHSELAGWGAIEKQEEERAMVVGTWRMKIDRVLRKI